MKRHLNFLLAQFPGVYSSLTRMTNPHATEKIAFLKLIKRGMVVFDIGGNRGHFTVLFSHLVGSSGRVYAFEPVPSTMEMLRQRIQREGRFKNVELVESAVGENSGTVTMHIPAGDDGQASMAIHTVASWESGRTRPVECRLTNLDDFVNAAGVKRLDFMKIDIEGAELFALKGSRETLSRFRPVVHFEFFASWTKSFGYDADAPIQFLRSLGYKNFRSGGLHLLDDPVAYLNASRESENIVASHGD